MRSTKPSRMRCGRCGLSRPKSWYAFFVAFTVAMTAMRVLICWIYTNTESSLLAQFMHVSSTGSLVIFGAPRVSASQEAFWYGLYGITLWVVVAIIAKTYGRHMTRQTANLPAGPF